MGTLGRWFRKPKPPLEGDIDPVYTKDDVKGASRGHMPFEGSDIEVVAFREGNDLVVLVNKTVCVFRTTLVGAFRNDLNVTTCNMLMRDERIVLGRP